MKTEQFNNVIEKQQERCVDILNPETWNLKGGICYENVNLYCKEN